MGENSQKLTAILASIFSALALAVCLYRSATKPILIEGSVKAREQSEFLTEYEDLGDGYDVAVLEPAPSGQGEDDLDIPLPINLGSEAVSIENHYLSRQLWITLSTDSDIYDVVSSGIKADADKVREGVYIRSGNGTVSLRFKLTGLYEPEISLAERVLHVKLRQPSEAFEHVVLLDPLPGSSSGADITFETAEVLEDMLTGEGIGVYLTRTGRIWSDETSLQLLSETDADLVIRITPAAVDETSLKAVKTRYNDVWYVRQYPNAEFAMDVAQSVADAAGFMVAGVDPAGEEDELLSASMVPSVELIIGCGRDALVADPQIPARTAEGLAGAVRKALAQLGEN